MLTAISSHHLAQLKAERAKVEADCHAQRRWKTTLTRIVERSEETLAELEHRLTWLDGAIHALEEQAEGDNQH